MSNTYPVPAHPSEAWLEKLPLAGDDVALVRSINWMAKNFRAVTLRLPEEGDPVWIVNIDTEEGASVILCGQDLLPLVVVMRRMKP